MRKHARRRSGAYAKRGIGGVQSQSWGKQVPAGSYLNSYAFRWNHRDADDPMFFEMLKQIPLAPDQRNRASSRSQALLERSDLVNGF